MKKLTFNELSKSEDLMTQNELLSILGGRGAVTGNATGASSTEAITISATYFTVGSIDGVAGAASQFNSAEPVLVNGKWYKYEVNIQQCANVTDAATLAANLKNADGTCYGNVVKIGTATDDNDEETWGETVGDSTIVINSAYTNSAFSGAEANRSGTTGTADSGISRSQFNSNLMVHEMLHTFGMNSEGGAGANGSVYEKKDSNGNVIGFTSNSLTQGNVASTIGNNI